MKILNRKIEFQAYKDGVCDIFYEDEEGEKSYRHKGLHFDNRTLGYGRHFAAKAVQVEVDSVIRIPLVRNVSIHDTVAIKGVGKFSIELIQTISDVNPLSLDLTLRQLEAHNNEYNSN